MFIIINSKIIRKMLKLTFKNVEHFGKLVSNFNDGNFYINKATFSNKKDILMSTTFKEVSSIHCKEIQKWSKRYNIFFIGTWHSHRHYDTIPSQIDKNSFFKNYECTIFKYSINIIISVNQVSFYLIEMNKIYYVTFNIKDIIKNNELKINIENDFLKLN